MTERQALEAIEKTAECWYERTGDPWYAEICEQVEKRLRGKKMSSILIKKVGKADEED